MPRLLIAGCGYLGQAVADLFVAASWEVEGWTMSSESADAMLATPLISVADIGEAFGVTKRAPICFASSWIEYFINRSAARPAAWLSSTSSPGRLGVC